MRVAILLFVITVIGYVLYQNAKPAVRKTAIRKIAYHGIRLLAIIAVIALAMAASFYLAVSSILP